MQFPELCRRASDAPAVYAGVRPFVAGGHDDPSRESRESAMWTSPGLIGITGGKLTTFRVTARQVLAAACSELPQLAKKIADDALFGVTGGSPTHERIDGRFGAVPADQNRSPPPEDRTAPRSTPPSLELGQATRRKHGRTT